MNSIRFDFKYVLTILSLLVLFSHSFAFVDENISANITVLLPPVIDNGNSDNYLPVLEKIKEELSDLDGNVIFADTTSLNPELLNDYKNAPVDVENLVNIGKNNGYSTVISLVFRNVGSQTTFYSLVIDIKNEEVILNETNTIPLDKNEKSKFTKLILAKLISAINNDHGVLVIDTKPEASSVALDDEGIGIAPVTVNVFADTKYKISVHRLGWETAHKNISVSKGDTAHVYVKMKRITESMKKPPISLRIWANYGWPLYDQNFQSNDLFMKGNSKGGVLEFGYSWRLRFAVLSYNARFSDDDFTGFDNAYGNTAPTAKATILQAAIVYGFNASNYGPYLALGFNGVRRDMEVNDLESVTRYSESDYEAAWSFLFGFEWPLYKNFGMQFEIMYTNSFYDPESWKEYGNYTAEQEKYWKQAYNEFKDFTILRLGIGYRI